MGSLARPGGSSPLTRGALVQRRRPGNWRRLIPAHAGSTTADAKRALGEKAHPRSRGEHSSKTRPDWASAGSSPLTRGAPAEGLHPTPRVGLIPAHAGSTQLRVQRGKTSGAHPRSRGEHFDRVTELVELWGSSPLTRGALNLLRREDLRFGLIPAHAGST